MGALPADVIRQLVRSRAGDHPVAARGWPGYVRAGAGGGALDRRQLLAPAPGVSTCVVCSKPTSPSCLCSRLTDSAAHSDTHSRPQPQEQVTTQRGLVVTQSPDPPGAGPTAEGAHEHTSVHYEALTWPRRLEGTGRGGPAGTLLQPSQVGEPPTAPAGGALDWGGCPANFRLASRGRPLPFGEIRAWP
jgi:hypothetical protein